MKKWNRIVASLLVGVTLLTACHDTNVAKEYSSEELKQAKQKIEYNLGQLNKNVSDAEKEKQVMTVAEIQECVKEREKENLIEPNAREAYLRKEFDEWITGITQKYYGVEDEEETEPAPVKENNNDRIYAYLESVMKKSEVASLKKKIDQYIETGDEEAYDFAQRRFDALKDVNGNLLLFLLVQYPNQKTERVYRVKGESIQEEPFLSEQSTEKRRWFQFFRKELKSTQKEESFSNEKENIILASIPKVIKRENLKNFDYILLCTDGKSYGLASVIESPDGDGSGTRWLMQIDSNDLDDDFYGTLVHEYGHYLTLNQTQADYTEDYDIKNYCEIGMVTKKDSLLNQFYQTFWKDYVLEEFPTKYSFYVRNQDAFVSDYAATDPTEDIAETFRVFVMEKKPTGNTIRDKKVRFLYDWPGYPELRREIRKNLKLDK